MGFLEIYAGSMKTRRKKFFNDIDKVINWTMLEREIDKI